MKAFLIKAKNTFQWKFKNVGTQTRGGLRCSRRLSVGTQTRGVSDALEDKADPASFVTPLCCEFKYKFGGAN